MELINTKSGYMLVIRDKSGKIRKVYAGPIAITKSKQMFNPINQN